LNLITFTIEASAKILLCKCANFLDTFIFIYFSFILLLLRKLLFAMVTQQWQLGSIVYGAFKHKLGKIKILFKGTVSRGFLPSVFLKLKHPSWAPDNGLKPF
jgi:hypothetical protein